MTDAELRELVASLATRHAETEAALEQTVREVREIGRQIGYLGNKFGSFAEGLAFESVEKILSKTFHADTIARRLKTRRGGTEQEYDVLGIRNGVQNEIYCVEIKSRLDLEELNKSLQKFRHFFDLHPQYRGMKLYGVIAAVDVRGALADRVAHEGLYLATAGDDNFKLVKPKAGFKARAFT